MKILKDLGLNLKYDILEEFEKWLKQIVDRKIDIKLIIIYVNQFKFLILYGENVIKGEVDYE